jgi:hypothetical protein
MPAAQGLTHGARRAGVDAIAAVRREINTGPEHRPSMRSMTDQIDQFMAPLREVPSLRLRRHLRPRALGRRAGRNDRILHGAARPRIGIRMALGAQRRDVLGLMMREGMRLVLAGTAIGMAGAWTRSRLLSALNSGVGHVTTSTTNPAVLFGAPCCLYSGPVGLLCAGTQVVRIDPVVALRQE